MNKLIITNKKFDKKFKFCICIPSYDEYQFIIKTLNSLKQVSNIEQALISININNYHQNPLAFNNNNKAFEYLSNVQNLNILISDNRKTYLLKRGIGLARQQAIQNALPFLQEQAIIICLDADTLVEKNYLLAVEDFYNNYSQCVSYIKFKHQISDDENINQAREIYEFYLNDYVEKLRYACSPYAYHSIGSTIVSPLRLFNKIGGMDIKRLAGEDFFFLQKARKYFGEIKQITKTCVFPSVRLSKRTIYGTGQALSKIIKGQKPHFISFKMADKLKNLLIIINQNLNLKPEKILKLIACLETREFLLKENFIGFWLKVQNKTKQSQLERRFLEWFDALKTYRFLKVMLKK